MGALDLSRELVEVLGAVEAPTRQVVAERLAELSGLAAPSRPGSILVLSEIVLAVQECLIDKPDGPMDRALAADTPLAMGAIRAGTEAVHETFSDLGNDSLDEHVRGAIYDHIAPGLAERGVIDPLIGG